MSLIDKIKKFLNTKKSFIVKKPLHPHPQLNYKELCEWLYHDVLSYNSKYINNHNEYYAIKDILECRFYDLIHIGINHVYSGELLARSYTASETDIENAIKLFNSMMRGTRF